MNGDCSNERRRDLRAAIGDGMAYAAMVGFGETYASAFALALGHGELAAALISTAPLLTGAALQLLTPAGVIRLGSHRRWVVACAWTQVAAFVPLIAGALSGRLPLALLFATMAVYWAAGFSAGSAWNAWMVGLVHSRLRPTFFARRSRLSQVTLSISLIGGGALLHFLAGRDAVLRGFALLFGLAALSRAASARFLGRQSDTPPDLSARGQPPRELFRTLARGPSGRLFAYLIALQMAVNVASPYFTPFMLRELELPYGAFAGLTATSFVSRIAVLPLLGRLARRYGARRLLTGAGIAVIPLPALWLVSDRLPYLFCLQLASGAIWGAYELAVLLLFFEMLAGPSRLQLLALYNVANAAAMLGGSLIGGSLFAGLPGASAYAAIFGVSTGARLLTLALLRGLPQIRVQRAPIPTRTVAVRPSYGALQPPVVAALEPEPGESAGAAPAPPTGGPPQGASGCDPGGSSSCERSAPPRPPRRPPGPTPGDQVRC
jgi:hypothetical protein